MHASDVSRTAVFRPEALRNAAAIRQAFAGAGFNQDVIARLLGIRHPAETMDVEMLSLRCAEPTPLHILFRLFILAQRMEDKLVRLAFQDGMLEELIECGLLTVAEGGIGSVANLAPYGDILVASDFGFSAGQKVLAADHVLGVGPSSVTLANLTVRQESGSFYDLGCGSGIQALLGAHCAARVIASDISARALSFAAFNSRLNGLQNIEWRCGSFFDPAGEECFDTVACNPPFVISPGARFIYRDGGMGGDGVSERVARGAGPRLKEGGFASMLINWIQVSDEDWARRPLSWVEGNGCDAWVIRSSDTEPISYAANWLRQSEDRDRTTYRARLQEWVDYLRDSGIERIASGMLVLRRRSGAPNWQRADVMDGSRASGQCGTHIRDVFACEDFLQQHRSEEALFASRFRVPEKLVSEQLYSWNEETWSMKAASLSLTDGLPFSGRVDGPFLGILRQCSGKRTLAEIVDDFLKEEKGEPARIRAAIANVVRNMVRGAMLLPAA